jgi:hypothetical protein
MELETFEKVCTELESTWEGLTTICDRHKVKRTTFLAFKDKDKERIDRYARARELQLDYLEDLLMTETMNNSNDGHIEDRVNLGGNHVARSRLKVDTLKFVLGKLRSHTWGDKTKIEGSLNIEQRIFKGIDLNIVEENNENIKQE